MPRPVVLKTEAEMRKIREDATSENVVERRFISKCHEYKCRQKKNVAMYSPEGWPDRMIIWRDGRGTTDWVELKKPKGSAYQRKQLEMHEQLRELGCRVEVLFSKEQVDEYFQRRAVELGVRQPFTIKRGRSARLMCATELL